MILWQTQDPHISVTVMNLYSMVAVEGVLAIVVVTTGTVSLDNLFQAANLYNNE